MNRMQEQVREFHERFGHPISARPGFSRPFLRASLIVEEAVETAFAMLVHEFGADANTHLHAMLHQALASALRNEAEVARNPLPAAVDGMCDLSYVTFGAAIEMGIDLEPFFDEVHRSNMAKVGGATREDGKTLKPEGWEPPAIERLLGEAMAKGDAA